MSPYFNMIVSLEEDRCTQRALCDNEGRDRVMQLQAKGCQRLLGNEKVRRGKEGFPSRFPKKQSIENNHFRLLVLRTIGK